MSHKKELYLGAYGYRNAHAPCEEAIRLRQGGPVANTELEARRAVLDEGSGLYCAGLGFRA